MRGYGAFFAAFFVLALGANFLLAQIPNDERAVRAGENLGLTDVRVIDRGMAWGVLGGCHQDDITKFTLTGTAADGSTRTIEVCAPIIGGYTVRS
jgi:hypothetical protein